MADATATMELEDDSLSAGLDGIAALFAEIAGQINAAFTSANAQLSRTTAGVQSVGAASPVMNTLASALSLVASTARTVTTAVSGIALTLTRVAPFVKYIPDSFAKWAPGVKKVAAEYVELAAKVGLVTKAAAALTGRLTVLQAAFGVLDAREVGASRSAAIFGAAGALALSKTIALSRTAVGALGSVGARFSSIANSIRGSVGSAFAGVGRVGMTFGALLGPVAALGLALGPIGASVAGVAAGFALVKRGVSTAAETQQLQTSFITLLGSADAARKRMAELNKFAQETPFQIPGVARASRVLEVLTKGALSTGAGLRMAGDVAAVAGQPIEDLAVHIGRVYSALMHGGEAGESFRRLTELGVISMETRAKLEALQKQGLKGSAVWAIAGKDLMRFSGEMQRQSMTWNGMLSNFEDAVGNVFRALGEPIIVGLSPYFQKLINLVGTLNGLADRFGNIIGGWGALIGEIISEGKVGEALSRVSKIAFMEAVNWLAKGLAGAGNVMVQLMATGMKNFVTLLQAATTPQFWAGVGNALMAAGQGLISILLEGVAKVLDAMRDLPKIGGAIGRAADKAHGLAGDYAEKSTANASKAAPDLAPLFDAMKKNIADYFAHIGEAFKQGQEAVGDVFDTGAAKADFAAWIKPIAEAAQKLVASTKAAAEAGGMPPPIGSDDTTAAGKTKNEVAGLQKIAGGGGFTIHRADPLLTEAQTQTKQLEGINTKLTNLTAALVNRRPEVSTPIFS